MVNYNSSDVVQCLRQYDMFANSLRLIRNQEERNMIVKQLSKLEKKIIALTNEAYLEEYNELSNKKCGLLDEERNRLSELIDLINQRLSYVEKRCNSHYQLTGESNDVSEVEGASLLDSLEERVKIIDKYTKNVKLEKELEEEIKSLSSKITLATEKMGINEALNVELEATFKKTLEDAFSRLGLYELRDAKDELDYAFYETEKSLSLARLNYETAKTHPANIINDCAEMLKEITNDYELYKDKISILQLMDMCDKEVNSYDELLEKRKEVNEILKYIKNQDLLHLIIDTVNKQFNTITMEEQDINTFKDLTIEKERKQEAIKEIEEENNSMRFQSVLKELIENERKHQEKIMEEQRRIEEIERQKRLEIERKRQEEILRRQKIIEEARKKEIEKRTKQLLEEQQNSVLQGKKKEEKVDFEKLQEESEEPVRKEIIEPVKELEEEKEEKIELRQDRRHDEEETKEPEFRFDLNSMKNILDNQDDGIDMHEEKIDIPIIKDKDSIEKELFEEFKNEYTFPIENKVEEEVKEESIPDNNKFPDMSIDEYMKNFTVDESKTDDLFGDTSFPSIPM